MNSGQPGNVGEGARQSSPVARVCPDDHVSCMSSFCVLAAHDANRPGGRMICRSRGWMSVPTVRSGSGRSGTRPDRSACRRACRPADAQLLVQEADRAAVLLPFAALAPVAAEVAGLGRVFTSTSRAARPVGELVGALPVGALRQLPGEQRLVGLRQLDTLAADARQEHG